MRDAFPIVCKLGDRLAQSQYGWRDTKALIVLVAQAGDWNGASCLADALGVPPDLQESIYAEVYTQTGGATPEPTTAHREKAHHERHSSTDRVPGHGDRRPRPEVPAAVGRRPDPARA